MSESVIGTAKFGSETKKKDYSNANWKVEANQPNVYRILPPFKTLAEQGRWAQYEAVVWGFKGTNGKQKPFKSIQRKGRNGMLEQDDPAVTWITSLNNQRQERLEEYKKEGMPLKTALAKVENLTELTSQYRVDKFFSVNVMRQDGAIGKLKLKIKAKQNLDLLFKRLMEEEGINPIDPSEGVWVDFRRNGEGRDTSYSCEVVYDVITEGNRKLKAIKAAPLSEKDLARMKDEAFDLPFSYREIEYEDIKRMVDSGGDPAVVDSVFGSPNFSNKTSFSDLSNDDTSGEEMSAESVLTSMKKPSKAASADTARFLDTLNSDDDE